MSERMIPVPESLIERIDSAYNNNASSDTFAGLIEELWMLSQPTPTAEPPRIEDLTPGSTFRADTTHGTQGELFFAAADGWYYNIMGIITNPSDIDPSTIRDVTPPHA
jgi:hypothetical protein